MRNLSCVLVMVLAAGCSGMSSPGSGAGGSGLMPSTPQIGAQALAKQAGSLYVLSLGTNAIAVYESGSTTPSRQITTGLHQPWILSTDASGTLYVANATDVSVYPPGASTPARRLSQGISSPSFVAADSKGNVYVSNTISKFTKHGNTSNGSVVEYGPSGGAPIRVMHFSIPGLGGPIAVDGTGYVYVADTPTRERTANVQVFGPTGDAPVRTIPGFAFDLAVDAQDHLYVTHPSVLDAYSAHGATSRWSKSLFGLEYVAVNPSGEVFALTEAPLLAVYNSDGQLERQVTTNFKGPFTGLATGPGSSAFAATGSTTVGTSEFVTAFGPAGFDLYDFRRASGVHRVRPLGVRDRGRRDPLSARSRRLSRLGIARPPASSIEQKTGQSRDGQVPRRTFRLELPPRRSGQRAMRHLL